MHDSYWPPASSPFSFHLHPSKWLCSTPDSLNINWEAIPSETLNSHEFHKVQQHSKRKTQFHVLTEQKVAAWAQAHDARLKIYTTTESSESVWAAALHSAFFTTSKKGLEEHMKQRIVRKVCIESSSRATEQITVKYLQYALLANVNHNDLGPTTMSNEKYHSASSVCYR